MMEATDEEPAPTASPAAAIRAIDRASVHHICSGQVVLTLATAVKELVENSLDAGATSVEVRLKEYGAELVEVSDNGSGVSEDDLQGMTLKHHTSKLQDFSDLSSVETFGFRGEALSSLCALSDVSVVTCVRGASAAVRAVFDREGRVAHRGAAARPPGTTISLAHIFSSLPVRHKEFLRGIKKEFARMVRVLQAYCVVSAGVRISCSNQSGAGGRRSVVLATAAAPAVRDNIAAVFGAKQLQTLLPLQQIAPSAELCQEFGLYGGEVADTYRLSGFVSRCDHGAGRSSADRQFIFVNGRPCDLAKVSKLVNEVYHTYNRHQYPFLVLHIASSTELVDVNVTPDKRLLLLQEERLLLAVVKATLCGLYEPTLGQLPVAAAPRVGPAGPPRSAEARAAVSGLGRAFAFRPSSGPGRGAGGGAPARSEDPGSFRREDCGREAAGGTAGSDASARQEEQEEQERREGHQEREEEETAGDGSAAGPSGSPRAGAEVAGAPGDVGDVRGEDRGRWVAAAEKQPEEEEGREGSGRPPSAAGLARFQRTPIRAGPPGVAALTAPRGSATAKRCRSGSSARRRHWAHAEEAEEEEAAPDTEEEAMRDGAHAPDRPHEDDGAHTVDVATRLNRRVVPLPFSMERLRARRSVAGKSPPCLPEGCSFRAKISPSDNHAAEEELRKKFHKHMFERMEVVGQFNLGFVVARLGSDLFIVDQHAADEKYNYERLRGDGAALQGQRLIAPLKLPLTAVGEIVLMDNIDIFRKNGFDFIIDEQAPPTERVRLKTLPVQRGWMFGVSDVEELVFLLSDRPGVMCRPSRVQQMLASKACRKSVMVGTALNATEMRRLLLHMGEMEQPWNCPHGRPTMRHLVNMELLTGPGGGREAARPPRRGQPPQHAAAVASSSPADSAGSDSVVTDTQEQ